MKFRSFGIALVLALMICPLVMAQGPRGGEGRGRGFGGPGGPGGFGGMMRGGFGINRMALLDVEEVQKELDLLDEQVKEIRDLAGKMREEGRGGRGGDRPNFREMSEEERQAWMQERQKEAAERAQKVDEELKNILLEPQIARLDQIYVQTAGAMALNDPKVSSQLSVTESQKDEMQKVREESMQASREQMREAFQGGDRDAAREKMEQLQKETDAKVIAVLTADQQAQWKEMHGEPFKMPEDALRRGGRGRGQGGPGGEGGFRRQRGEGGEGGPRRGRGEGRPERPRDEE